MIFKYSQILQFPNKTNNLSNPNKNQAIKPTHPSIHIL